MTGERLYDKYIVTRTDSKSHPGEKHYGCEYFVLDLTHDPAAVTALRAYCVAVEHSRPQLVRDIAARYPELGL